MSKTIALLLFFTIVTISHALFLTFAKTLKDSNKQRALWKIHYPINGILWVVLAVWIAQVQFIFNASSFPFYLRLIGLALSIGGLLLTVDGLRRLGFKQAMGSRFFSLEKLRWVSSGSYSFLSNPIYDGFILIFLGLGFLTGINTDFYLAAASFILLNLFLATVENENMKLSSLL